MRWKWVPWLILMSILVVIQIKGVDNLRVNYLAIEVSKNQLRKNSGDFFLTFLSRDFDPSCHLEWLNFIQYSKNKLLGLSESSKLLVCSSLHMSMLYYLYPGDIELAQLSIEKYPNQVKPFYWLISSSDPTITEKSKPWIETILQLNPKDGLAWRYLGRILEWEGNIKGALEAYINCCFNDDPGLNGCLNAGRLLEKEGRYEEAISFYRLSSQDFIRANADRLEEMLAGSQ